MGVPRRIQQKFSKNVSDYIVVSIQNRIRKGLSEGWKGIHPSATPMKKGSKEKKGKTHESMRVTDDRGRGLQKKRHANVEDYRRDGRNEREISK